VFVGVIDPINPKVETPQEVRDRVLEAADFIPLAKNDRFHFCTFAGSYFCQADRMNLRQPFRSASRLIVVLPFVAERATKKESSVTPYLQVAYKAISAPF
jgi:hypothetical protein